MTPPHTSSKVLLVPDVRTAGGSAAPVALRRYRITRLRLDARSDTGTDRFAHLKRSFD